VERQQAIAELRHKFPELQSREASHVELRPPDPQACLDVYDCATFVTEQFEAAEDTRVHAAFECMERFLSQGDRHLREWVSAWVDAVQNTACWRRYGSAAFSPFLGPETRALWEALDTVRTASDKLDLSDYSVLEAEILTWRMLREKARLLAGSPHC
jgi:hypothetical protein